MAWVRLIAYTGFATMLLGGAGLGWSFVLVVTTGALDYRLNYAALSLFLLGVGVVNIAAIAGARFRGAP